MPAIIPTWDTVKRTLAAVRQQGDDMHAGDADYFRADVDALGNYLKDMEEVNIMAMPAFIGIEDESGVVARWALGVVSRATLVYEVAIKDGLLTQTTYLHGKAVHISSEYVRS